MPDFVRKGFRFLIRKLIWWGLIPLLVFFVLIRVFNPEVYLMDHLSQELLNQSGILLAYNRVTFSFPGTLTLTDFSLKQHVSRSLTSNDVDFELPQQTYFSGNSLTIGVSYLQLLRLKAAIHFQGAAYGGKFSGSLDTFIQTTPSPLNISVTWVDIDLERLSFDYTDLQVTKGFSSGNADLISDFTRHFVYKGVVNLNINDSFYKPSKSFTGDFDLPAFNSASATIELDFATVTLRDVRLYSPDTVIRILGTVHQKIPASATLLDLQIRIHFVSSSQPFDEDMYVPINLKGAVSDPQVLFLGRAL